MSLNWNWIDPAEYSFNSFLLLERFQIRLMMNRGGWGNDKAKWKESMGIALRANPAVKWYFMRRCPECASAVEELAAAQSFEQVVTHVYHTNRIALAMFESAGFTQIGPPKGGNIFLRKRYMRSPFLA